jgi:hypothetical protein
MKKGAISCVGILLVAFYSAPAAGANLTLTTGGRVTIELLFSEADFRNTLSVIAPTVTVAIRGCKLEPADGLTGEHILSENISQRGCRVELDADPSTPGIQPFAAGTTFTFGLCAQTNPDPTCEFLWSSDPAQNSDGFDHLRTTPLRPADFPGQIFQLAWEDLPGGGDSDFNDLIAVVRVNVDTDGDGLWDDWERFGIDTDGNGTIDLDLPALGANPMRKDIFLEIDFMNCAVAGGDCAMGDTHSHRPKQAAIDAVIQAFANAPVMNPDGSTGITLHVDVSNAILHQNALNFAGGPSIGSFDAVKADTANFGPTNPRRFAFHYALFTHREGPDTTSGRGERPGNDFYVSLGEWNTICLGAGPNNVLDTVPAGDDISDGLFIYTGPNLTCNTTATGDDIQFIANGGSPANDLDGDGLEDRSIGTIQQQAGTLMHELGHNLNLVHGGDPDPAQREINNKPNYLSVMNYSFQTRGIPPTDPDGPAGPLTARVDYSRADLADLDENNLNEPIGIGNGTDSTVYMCPPGAPLPPQRLGVGTGPINWDCDGNSTDTGIAVNINGDGMISVLTGFNDWANLKFDFQNTMDFEDGDHSSSTTLIEMDFATHLQIPAVVTIDITPRAFPNIINITRDPNRIEVISVAILTTATFDATTTVDRTTVRFGKTGTEAAPVQIAVVDANGDGALDLVLHFRTQDTGLQCGDTSALLTGETVDGETILAADAIVTVRGGAICR